MEKTTLVIGASPKSYSYSYRCMELLTEKGVKGIGLGRAEGKVGAIPIVDSIDKVTEPIHTVTLYLRADRQPEYYDYILGLNPKRLIFNPGAENNELYELAQEKGIEVHNACNLVMLTVGLF